MSDDHPDGDSITPEVVEGTQERSEGPYVTEPSKLIRIASMTRAMLDEVRQAPLDDAGRDRLLEVYQSSIGELKDVLSPELVEELETVFVPLDGHTPSESELRVAQAQLVGWLEGLFSGIQATLWSHQMSAAAQLEELRRRHALEARTESSPAGPYL